MLASLFPALKITPCAKELFNDKYQERLRPTPSPSAQCQAKPKISLPYGWVGKPQANKEMRAREPTEQSWQDRVGREAGYLHRAHPARVGPRCARAREREHTHTHTHTRRRVFVGTPRAIPHQVEFRESRKQVCPRDKPPSLISGTPAPFLQSGGMRTRWERKAGLRCSGFFILQRAFVMLRRKERRKGKGERRRGWADPGGRTGVSLRTVGQTRS